MGNDRFNKMDLCSLRAELACNSWLTEEQRLYIKGLIREEMLFDGFVRGLAVLFLVCLALAAL